MSEEKTLKGLAAGLLIGGAIGGAIALLYAPKSGRQLRYDISKKTNELILDGKTSADELWTDTKDRVGNILESTNNFLHSGKDKVVNETEKVQSGVNDFLHSSKDKIVNETEKVKEAVKASVSAYNEERTGRK